MDVLRAKAVIRAAAAAALAAAASCGAGPALGRYFEPAQVDLVHILAPPPAPQSAAAKADLDAVLAVQKSRSEAEVRRAQADDDLTVLRYADVMGPDFTAEKLPFTMAFFKDAWGDGGRAVNPVRAHFARPRPKTVDPRVEPVITANGGSYPSGTAAFATMAAIILADMVPEKAEAIFARAAEWGHNRVVSGVHYPSDVEAGRIAGSVIDNVLLHDAAFMADFAKAKAEVRNALGLP